MKVEISKRYGFENTSFQAAGEVEGITQLVTAFYDIMAKLPEARELHDMHPDNIDISIDKLARFLCGWLGGPKRYQEKYGKINIPHAHQHLPVTQENHDAWLTCMDQAIDQQKYPEEFSSYLKTQLRVPANRILELSKG